MLDRKQKPKLMKTKNHVEPKPFVEQNNDSNKTQKFFPIARTMGRTEICLDEFVELKRKEWAKNANELFLNWSQYAKLSN